MKWAILLIVLVISSLGSVGDEVRVDTALHHIDVLTELSPRVTGSEDAQDTVIGGIHSTTLYIAQTLEGYGYDVEIEEFPVKTYQITQFTLVVDFDGDFSTPDQLDLSERAIPPTLRYLDVSFDVTAPLVYPEEGREGIPLFEYWELYTPGSPVGRSDISLVYKENEPAFSSHFRGLFSISYADYLAIRERKTPQTMVWVQFSSHTREVEGYNVIGVRRGGERNVVFCAHYDSVFTKGAIDNGSGVAALLETARILSSHPVYADVYFVFVDGEELGLLGSRAFVEGHSLDRSVCINVDSIASGDTFYVGGVPRYKDMWASYYHTDPALDTYVAGVASRVLGYTPGSWALEDVGGYSDFVSFTEVGISTTDISAMDKEALKFPVISEEKLTDHATLWIRGGRTVYFNEDRFSKVVPYIHTLDDDRAHVNTSLFSDGVEIVAETGYQLTRQWSGEVAPTYFVILLIAIVLMLILRFRRSL